MRHGTKHWRPEEDERLLALAAAKVPQDEIARRLGKPDRRAIASRLYKLRHGDAAIRRRKWTAREDALLREAAGDRGPADLARELGRTPTAVATRACALGIRFRQPRRATRHTGFTAAEVARLLGIPCSKTVGDWIRAGYLVGHKRPVGPRNRRNWRIMPDALGDFLRTYRWLYLPGRIADPGWRRYVAALPPVEYVTTREAARLLPYTIGGIDKLIRVGDLPAERWGPNWRIPLAAIHAFVPPPPSGAAVRVQGALRARRQAVLTARRSTRRRADPAIVAKQVAARAARRALKAA